MQEPFYRALEDKFRGQMELIKSRLQIYVPFIKPFEEIYSKSELKAIDLGCGRGEWLEIMQENEFIACGIDLDEGMLEACRKRSLNVVQTDIFDYIKTQKDESLLLITGFHIAEHLPFENLLRLIKESLRILKPGGLLIIESPNPENIVLGTTNFYIDPTHQRPLSPLLLSFIVEYTGFKRFKTLRLQEQKDILNEDKLTLYNVLTGVSPDFAVVAQKKADENILSHFNPAFDKDYGVDLNKIALKYDNTIQIKFNDLKNWQEISVKFLKELDIARSEYQSKERALQTQLNYWENITNNLKNELHSVYTSKSWRITKPMRFAMRVIKKIFKNFKLAIKIFLIYIIKIISAIPVLKKMLSKILNKFPKIKNRLRNISIQKTILQKQHINKNLTTEQNNMPDNFSMQEKQVYEEFKNELNELYEIKQRRD
jgi:O-antigen chain-terminating methyltransferase